MKGIILNSEQVNTILETGDLEYRKAVKKHHPQGIHGVEYSLGDVGDKLFVKETFLDVVESNEYGQPVYYDENDEIIDDIDEVDDYYEKESTIYKVGFDWEEDCVDSNGERFEGRQPPWEPATNMRQDQSRLTVEITDIKVEKADVWEWVVNLKLIK